MVIEIERKFMVANNNWEKMGTHYFVPHDCNKMFSIHGFQ